MDRSKVGRDVYVSSMEKSASDKMKVFPFIKPGIIADVGAGAGPVTELLAHEFTESTLLAVDMEDDMIERLHKRFDHKYKVEVIQSRAETFRYSKQIDTVLYISTLHEIFSFNDYSHQVVLDTLANTFDLLVPGGRLIIRDGVQPEQHTMYVKPLNNEAYERFNLFSKQFKVREFVFNEGTIQGDSFIQHKAENIGEFFTKNFLFELNSQDVSEFMSKYFYQLENWGAELNEQFGIWTLREYQHVLINLGFSIKYAETYVVPFLLENHYSKDFKVFELNSGKLIKAPYPPSTMILVGEKTN